MICDVIMVLGLIVICLNRDMVGKVIVVTGGNKGIGLQVQIKSNHIFTGVCPSIRFLDPPPPINFAHGYM